MMVERVEFLGMFKYQVGKKIVHCYAVDGNGLPISWSVLLISSKYVYR